MEAEKYDNTIDVIIETALKDPTTLTNPRKVSSDDIRDILTYLR